MKYWNKRRIKFLSVLLIVALLNNIVPMQTWADYGSGALIENLVGADLISGNDRSSSDNSGSPTDNKADDSVSDSETDDEITNWNFDTEFSQKYENKNGVKKITVTITATTVEYQLPDVSEEQVNRLLDTKVLLSICDASNENKILQSSEVTLSELKKGVKLSVSKEFTKDTNLVAIITADNKERYTEYVTVAFPKDIELDTTLQEFTIGEKCNNNHNSSITEHIINLTGELVIKIAKQDNPIPLSDREEDVMACLEDAKFVINSETENNKEIYGISLFELYKLKNPDAKATLKDFAKELMKSETVTLPLTGQSFTVEKYGTYAYMPQYTNGTSAVNLQKDASPISIDMLEQSFIFEFVQEEDRDNVIEYGEKVIYELQENTIYAGNFDYIVKEGSEVNEVDVTDKFKITFNAETKKAEIIGNAIGTFNVSFTFSGNEIYNERTQTIALTIEKKDQAFDFEFERDEDGDKSIEYGETVFYVLKENTIPVGEFEYAVEDKDQNDVTDKFMISFDQDTKTAQIIGKAVGQFDIYFKFSGDEVYRDGQDVEKVDVKKLKQSFAFHFEQEEDGDGVVEYGEKSIFALQENAIYAGSFAYVVKEIKGDDKIDVTDQFEITFDEETHRAEVIGNAIGTFEVTFIFLGNEIYQEKTDTVDLGIEQITQSFTFELEQDEDGDELIEYGEKVFYILKADTIPVGEFKYAVEDMDENDVTKKFDILFDEDTRTAQVISKMAGKCKIDFIFSGNEIYSVGKDSVEVDVKKLKQSFAFEFVQEANGDGVIQYGEKVIYALQENSIYAGNFDYAVKDSKGNEVSKETFQVRYNDTSKTVEVIGNKIGTFTLSFIFMGNEGYEKGSTDVVLYVDKLEQNFAYLSDLGGDQIAEYGETVTYSLRDNSIYAGNITCTILDNSGKKVNDKFDINVNQVTKEVAITGKVLGTYTVVFHFTGNEIYKNGSCEVTLAVQKAKLQGTVVLSEKTTKFLICKKTKTYATVTLSAENAKLYTDVWKNIKVRFVAITEGENKEVELGVIGQKSFEQETLTYSLDITKKIDELKANGEYIMRAEIICDEEFPYVTENGENTIDMDNTVQVENADLTVTVVPDKSDFVFELGDESHTIHLNVYENKTEAPTSPIQITYHSLDKSILTVDANGNLHPLRAGSVRVTYTVDDAADSGLDVYNPVTGTIHVKVTSPSNTKYTITTASDGKVYNSIEDFYHAANGTINTNSGSEYWYTDNITITITAPYYTHIKYSIDGVDMGMVEKSLIIKSSIASKYNFSFCNEDLNISNGRFELNKVGVDKLAPAVENHLVSSVKPSIYSTGAVDYFATDIVMSAYADDQSENKISTNVKTPMDAQSGIETIEVWNADEGTWELTDNADRYLSAYTYSLKDTYTTAKVRFTDYVGRSTIVEYRGAYLENKAVVIPEGKSRNVRICIDKVNPKLAITAIQLNDNQGYNGEWTEHPVKYLVKLDSVQTSGIAAYEYAYVRRGESFSEADWKRIETSDFSVSFGVFLEDIAQQEQTADFIYPDTQAAENVLANEEVQLNGTVYFRAISNAARVTTDADIKASKQELRLWQHEMEQPLVYANKHAASTGWYNVSTKEDGQGVTISFDYPNYDAETYAPPVGLSITVEDIQQNEDGTFSVINSETKRYYKGIFEEAFGEVIELSDSNDYNSRVNLNEDAAITIEEDCRKIIKVQTFNLAGNSSDTYLYTVNADYNNPEVESIIFTASDNEYQQKLHTNIEEAIIYNVFSNTNIEVKANVNYGISGQERITLQQCKNVEDWKDTSTMLDGNTMTVEPNTRGFVYLTARDQAGNETSVWSDGFVADNQRPTGDTDLNITVIAEGENNQGFFNTNVPISIKVSDSLTGEEYSGLKSVRYSVGYDNTKTKSGTLYTFSMLQPTWQDIMETANFPLGRVVLAAEENESNEAFITVIATDNAGNEASFTQNYMIDITEPVIDITFDKETSQFGQYFLENRTATIRVQEKNFDPNLVEFTIFKDGAETETLIPSASSWRTVSEDVYTTQIVFSEDGDYSFSVSCIDKADNEAESKEVEEFTIDKTKPVVEISYDNNAAWKENYYNAARTATITVTEHNFEAQNFSIEVSENASLSGWTNQGDVHTIRMSFNEDGYYTLGVNYTDMAGNVMDEFAVQDFYIDTVAPNLAIAGVENQSANAGTVDPIIYASDINYDMDGISLRLTNSTGDTIALERATSIQNGEYSYHLTNVNGLSDDIYTLSVQATDLAGNSSEISYYFSLNRNGSTYDISKLTELMEKGYIRYDDLPDLHITEMNVDTIEEFSIYVSRNGEMYSECVEGTRPSSADSDTIYYAVDVEGNAEIGYQYHYTIFRENFTEEGPYNIMLYSKDRAGNEVNNTLTEKGAEINFVIDNTAPTVVIDGVEADTFYAEDEMNVNIYVDDNFKLEEAKFYLVDEDGAIIETYNYMELAESQGEVVTITLPNHNKRMSLFYTATDAAGNNIVIMEENEKVPSSFMISTNAWLAYINNERAVILTILGISAVLAGNGAIILYFKRKKGKVRNGSN